MDPLLRRVIQPDLPSPSGCKRRRNILTFPLWAARETESYSVVPLTEDLPVPEGGTTIPGAIQPASTTVNGFLLQSTLPRASISRGAGVVGMIEILTPFPDIPRRVIETKEIRQALSNGVSGSSAIPAVPHVIGSLINNTNGPLCGVTVRAIVFATQRIPEEEAGREPGAARVLPFSLGGEPIGSLSLIIQPFDELLAILPGDIIDRVIWPDAVGLGPRVSIRLLGGRIVTHYGLPLLLRYFGLTHVKLVINRHTPDRALIWKSTSLRIGRSHHE